MADVVTLARNLEIAGDARSITQTLLHANTARRFLDANEFWNPRTTLFYDLTPGEIAHTFVTRGDSPEDPDYHVPGSFIEGGTRVQMKTTITVDDKIIKAQRLPDIDQIFSRWDLIAPANDENVRLISEMLDKRMARLAVRAARSAAVSNVHSGGKVVTRTAASEAAAYPVSETGAENFEADASDLARKFDDDNIPRQGRLLFVNNRTVQVLTRSKKLMNRDYTPADITQYHSRAVGMCEGFIIVPTNHLPTTNYTADLSKYNVDASIGGSDGLPIGVAMWAGEGKAPIGCVRAGGLMSDVFQDKNRDVTLTNSKIVCGMGELHVWLAGIIQVHT